MTIYRGSCVLVSRSPAVIITADHVVRGDTRSTLPAQVYFPASPNRKWIRAVRVAHDSQDDVAALLLEAEPAVDPVQVAEADDDHPECVTLCGFVRGEPSGFIAKVSDYVARHDTWQESDGIIEHGQSGGAVLNEEGEVTGILSGRDEHARKTIFSRVGCVRRVMRRIISSAKSGKRSVHPKSSTMSPVQPAPVGH